MVEKAVINRYFNQRRLVMKVISLCTSQTEETNLKFMIMIGDFRLDDLRKKRVTKA